jgi:hypothetical protein
LRSLNECIELSTLGKFHSDKKRVSCRLWRRICEYGKYTDVRTHKDLERSKSLKRNILRHLVLLLRG